MKEMVARARLPRERRVVDISAISTMPHHLPISLFTIERGRQAQDLGSTRRPCPFLNRSDTKRVLCTKVHGFPLRIHHDKYL